MRRAKVIGHAAMSVIGNREENQDAYLDGPGVFGVFDGLGAHPRGQEAAETARNTVATGGALEDAGRAVCDLRVRGCWSERRPGTTAVVLDVNAGHFEWCGDSRLYFVAGGKLRHLTIDHSLAGARFTSGRVNFKEYTRETSNIVLSYLGLGEEAGLVIERGPLIADPGGRYLLLSDGLLARPGGDGAILEALTGTSPEQAVDVLVDGWEEWATDNVTVEVVDVEQES